MCYCTTHDWDSLNFTNAPSTPQTQGAFVTNTQPEATSDSLIIPIAVILGLVCTAVIGVCYYNSQRTKSTSEYGTDSENEIIHPENTSSRAMFDRYNTE